MRETKKGNPSFVESLAGDTKKGFCDATALPERLSRYSVAHHRALDMADYIKANVESKAFRHLPTELKTCGSYLVFRDYYTVGEIRLQAMSSCKKHLLCPLCAIRRGAKAMQTYLERLEIIQKETPGLKAYHLIFTVKNGEDLHERFKHIQRSLQKYHEKRKHGFNPRNISVEANKAHGAVWSYEFKIGKGSGLWHPHVHAIWLCHEEPDQKQIRNEWYAITGDSFNVRVVPFHNQSDVVGGFLEVFKYAVKFGDLPLDQNWHGYEVLSGKRLIGSFGSFRGVIIPERLEDDPLEDQPFVELFYRFIRGAGYSFSGSARYDQKGDSRNLGHTSLSGGYEQRECPEGAKRP